MAFKRSRVRSSPSPPKKKPYRKVWFLLFIASRRIEKTGSQKANWKRPADGFKGRVRVDKRFIFCRAILSVSTKEKAPTEGRCFFFLVPLGVEINPRFYRGKEKERSYNKTGEA